VDSAIAVEPYGHGVMVVIERRKRRSFALTLDEAAILHAQLARHLPPVTVTRQEPADRAPELAGRPGAPR
jgi:hypothetical protein